MSHRIFSVYGVELEYMIVDADSLRIRPACADILRLESGSNVSELERGDVSWSNELTAHIIELKTTEPVPSLKGLSGRFQSEVNRVNELAASIGARLLPTAMHPLMDPQSETVLWEHERNEIYAAFDRIFGCQGHGWANLQSTHINLPFTGNDEFGRLHAAVRMALPLLPAIAASSPVVEGRLTGLLDSRMDYYRANSKRIPSITASVVPEPVSDVESYERLILQRIYRDISPLDRDGTLQHEWLNARGAIARFDRGAIEIRVLDVQECPAVDLAILEFVVGLVRLMTESRWLDLSETASISTEALGAVFLDTVRGGESATIEDESILRAYGVGTKSSAGDVVSAIRSELHDLSPAAASILEKISTRGTLATRIIRALGPDPSVGAIREVYAELADCLATGRMLGD